MTNCAYIIMSAGVNMLTLYSYSTDAFVISDDATQVSVRLWDHSKSGIRCRTALT